MPRRCGPNCSPRSGAALSISTGLCSSGVASSVMPAMATASVSSFFICAVAAVLVAIFLRHNFAAVSTGVVEDPTWTSEPLRGPTSTVSCWLGFAFNSTLGYPGEGPPTCSEFDEGTELWLQELEMTKRLIEELPVVRDVTFYYHEDDPNLNYIQATLWCCWSGGRLKRLKEATDQTGKKPTHLEAAKALHDTVVKKHACEGHPYHPRAVARRQELAARVFVGPAPCLPDGPRKSCKMGGRKTQTFRLRRKKAPKIFAYGAKRPQNFRLRRRFPPPKSRLHIHWTPPTRADAHDSSHGFHPLAVFT
jgi:hypothetical protein